MNVPTSQVERKEQKGERPPLYFLTIEIPQPSPLAHCAARLVLWFNMYRCLKMYGIVCMNISSFQQANNLLLPLNIQQRTSSIHPNTQMPTRDIFLFGAHL